MAVVARLLPRLGSRRLVAVALVGYAACGPLVGLAPSVWALVAALFAWGAFQGMLDVSMNTQAIAVEARVGPSADERPARRLEHRRVRRRRHRGARASRSASRWPGSSRCSGWWRWRPCCRTVRWQVRDAAPARPGRRPGARERVRCAGRARCCCSAPWRSRRCCARACRPTGPRCTCATTGVPRAGVAGLGYTAFALAMTAVRLSGNAALARFARERLLPGLAAVACVGFTAALVVGGVWPTIIGFAVLGAGVGTDRPDRLQRRRRAARPARGRLGGDGLGLRLGRLRVRAAVGGAAGAADVAAGGAVGRSAC